MQRGGRNAAVYETDVRKLVFRDASFDVVPVGVHGR